MMISRMMTTLLGLYSQSKGTGLINFSIREMTETIQARSQEPETIQARSQEPISYSESVPVVMRVRGSSDNLREPVAPEMSENQHEHDMASDNDVMDHEFYFRTVWGKTGKNASKQMLMVFANNQNGRQ